MRTDPERTMNRGQFPQTTSTNWWRFCRPLTSATSWKYRTSLSAMTRPSLATTPPDSGPQPDGATTWIFRNTENPLGRKLGFWLQLMTTVFGSSSLAWDRPGNKDSKQTRLKRLLVPGLSKPRTTSVSGKPLASPRLISTNMHNDVSAPHVRYTLMVMQWGQFTDHDVIFTPVNKGTNFSFYFLHCQCLIFKVHWTYYCHRVIKLKLINLNLT